LVKDARALVRYLKRKHPSISEGSIPIYVHEDEDIAVRTVLEKLDEERAWAVVVLDSMEDGDVRYKIRMNYTTVPDTNWIVKWIARGLDTKYQRYYTSGFLSLQHAIDSFALSRATKVTTAGFGRGGVGTIDTSGDGLSENVGGRSNGMSGGIMERWVEMLVASVGGNRRYENEATERRESKKVNSRGEDDDVRNGEYFEDEYTEEGGMDEDQDMPMPIAAPMPTAAFSQNIFYQAVGFLIGLFMAMATMYPMSRLVKSIVGEPALCLSLISPPALCLSLISPSARRLLQRKRRAGCVRR
jgi:hypothetical protein